MVDIKRQTHLRTQDGCLRYTKEEQADGNGGLGTFPSPGTFIPMVLNFWNSTSVQEVHAINLQTQILGTEVISIWFVFVSSHWKFYENLSQVLFTLWHDAAKCSCFPLNILAKMFLHVLKETVLIEENVGTTWGHLCGKQNGLFPHVHVFVTPQFSQTMLILLPAGLTVEAYGSVYPLSQARYLKISNSNEIFEREGEREHISREYRTHPVLSIL